MAEDEGSIRRDPTLAVLFVEHLKDEILARKYDRPVPVKWVNTDDPRSEQEKMAARKTMRRKEMVWAILTADERHDPEYQRDAVKEMARHFVEMNHKFGLTSFHFDTGTRWFEVVEDETRVKMRVVVFKPIKNIT